MPPTVLVVPKNLIEKGGEPLEILRSAGFEIRFASPRKDLLTAEEVEPNLDGVEAVVAGSEPYTGAMLRRHPQIRVVSRVGVGYDSVDVATATELGIAVAVTPGTNHDSVAELTFALLLAIAKRVVPSCASVRAGGFERRTTEPIRGKTMGIVGYGRIGRAVARLARAFGMRVLVYDPVAAAVDEPEVERAPLEALLAASDVVSLHAPLVESTRRLIREETLALMKPGAILLNTARGGLVDEAALAAALQSGRVAGAGLDVYEREPPTGSPILRAPNVVLTPHVGGIDLEGMRQMSVMACRNVVDLHRGEWNPERIVNGDALGPSWRW
jgi:phosphoglycerate dehydrogenase-like enzyme